MTPHPTREAFPDAAEMDRCERILTACTCIPDYKNRGRSDPSCEACSLGVEVIDTFREMRRALLAMAADSERLDFLLSECAVVKTDGKRWRVEREWMPMGSEGPFADTPRAAIDTARQGAARGEGVEGE